MSIIHCHLTHQRSTIHLPTPMGTNGSLKIATIVGGHCTVVIVGPFKQTSCSLMTQARHENKPIASSSFSCLHMNHFCNNSDALPLLLLLNIQGPTLLASAKSRMLLALIHQMTVKHFSFILQILQ